jgi:hypothetical protein
VTTLGDLLAAASLLVALLTFLYGSAFTEISAARKLRRAGRNVDDTRADRERVAGARPKALGVAVAGVVVGAIFLPEALNRCWHFLRRLDRPLAAFHHYNALATSLVVVTAFCFLLAGHALGAVVELRTADRDLRGVA